MSLNLVGQKFGYLTVIEPTYKGKTKAWLCKCNCGNEIIVTTGHLRSGHTKSCGCYRTIKLKENRPQRALDLTNQVFGHLVALEPTSNKYNDGSIIWKCECLNCGNTHYVPGRRLKNLEITSCGCSKKSLGESTIESLLKDANIYYEREKTFSDCIFPDSLYKARFDFYCSYNGITWLIEFDGKQHFSGVGYGWLTQELFNSIQKHDAIKNMWAKEHNIELIRIPYTMLRELSLHQLLPSKLKEAI